MANQKDLCLVAEKPKRKHRTQPQPVCPVDGIPMLTYSVHRSQGVRYCRCPKCGVTAKQMIRD